MRKQLTSWDLVSAPIEKLDRIFYNPFLSLLDNVLHAILRDLLRNIIRSRTPQFSNQYKGGAFQLRVVLRSFSIWDMGGDVIATNGTWGKGRC